MRHRDPDSAVEYFSAALHASTAWPGGFPRQVAAAYDPAAGRLVTDWELPTYVVVPEARSVRYMSSVAQDKKTPRPVGQRRALYREVPHGSASFEACDSTLICTSTRSTPGRAARTPTWST
ncbi:hypothetical protein GCM10010365_59220 [Streptomyces poonensis]|uniref:Uncharacterized protein n=1 Tax=Streptomyces poonensis TaxID=68255 RepID=A0A918Q220_9ACTN|nr:hypothetical protein GCM10010365_59220 [Streptomyces poonensis]GLJ88247.1 hypothetical protein GCM10017589_08470 [Streptomyces poonensis]